MGWLVTTFSSIMILAYFFFTLACLIAATILIIMYRRQITFRLGQWPLRKERTLKTAFLNAGMIVYFVICCDLFILNWRFTPVLSYDKVLACDNNGHVRVNMIYDAKVVVTTIKILDKLSILFYSNNQ